MSTRGDQMERWGKKQIALLPEQPLRVPLVCGGGIGGHVVTPSRLLYKFKKIISQFHKILYWYRTINFLEYYYLKKKNNASTFKFYYGLKLPLV